MVQTPKTRKKVFVPSIHDDAQRQRPENRLLMSANLLSAYRTGAIPGVGAKYLARKDSKVVTIVGPGVMGKTSLAAFISVCPKIDM